MLLARNVGSRMSIDETQLHADQLAILSDKEGYGGSRAVAAVAAGTSADEVLKTLMRIPEEKRLAVEEVTMDFSESIHSIVVRCTKYTEANFYQKKVSRSDAVSK